MSRAKPCSSSRSSVRWPSTTAEDGRRGPPVPHPDAPAVARFAAERADRVRFHQWLQWLLDTQLARAAAELPVMQDLPIGVDPNGADAWAWQDVLATNVTVGAPPDKYNTLGQDWGLPPFIPHQLRAAAYEPFRQTIRATLRHAGGCASTMSWVCSALLDSAGHGAEPWGLCAVCGR